MSENKNNKMLCARFDEECSSLDEECSWHVEIRRMKSENMYLRQRIQKLHDLLEGNGLLPINEIPSWLGVIVPHRRIQKLKEVVQAPGLQENNS